jgi:protocatechuate 3,4-dioxygenase beta subunit
MLQSRGARNVDEVRGYARDAAPRGTPVGSRQPTKDDPMKRVRTHSALVVLLLLLVGALVFFARDQRTLPVEPSTPAPVVKPDLDDLDAGLSAVARSESVPTPPPSVQADAPEPDLVTLSGRIVDDSTDHPLAGVKVDCEPIRKDFTRATVSTRTDEDGRFSLTTPFDGTRGLHVSDAEHAPIWLTAINLPRELHPRQAADVRVGTIRMVRGSRPLVRVSDSEGKPCPGAELYLWSTGGIRSGILSLGSADEAGEWHAPFPVASQSWANVVAFHAGSFGWTELVQVPQDTTRHVIDIRTWPAPEISFHVRDPDGTPIEGATVDLTTQSHPFPHLSKHVPVLGPKSGKPFEAILSTKTDASGNAILRVPAVADPEFTWTVIASRPGPVYAQLEGLRSLDPKPQEIVVDSGHLVTTIVGTVLDTDGRPVPNAVVASPIKNATVDSITGSFRIELDAPQQVSLAMGYPKAPGYAFQSRKVRDEKSDPLTVDFVMARTSSISGYVVDEEGRPLANASVQAGEERFRGNTHGRTREDGSFVLSGVWKKESLQLYVQPPPEEFHRLLTREATMTRGEAGAHIVLVRDPNPPRGSIHARVLDAATKIPVPVLDVRFSGDRGMSMQRIGGATWRATDFGEFSAKPLAAGDWHAWVLSTERRVALANFKISDELPHAEIEVLVEPMRSIRGRLLVEGKPMTIPPGEAVSVWAICDLAMDRPQSGPWTGLKPMHRRDVRAAADGTFEIPEMPASEYDLHARGAGIAGLMRVHLKPGEDVFVDFRVRRPGDTAYVELTNLDSRFETPLLLRVEREGIVTEEFETNPNGERVQKFPIESGAITMSVYPISGPNQFPARGVLPVKKNSLVLAPGETRSFALYPR